MQTLDIILTVSALITNFALSFLVVYEWFALRRLNAAVRGMRGALVKTFSLVFGNHVKSMFDELNKMKGTLSYLVEHEQYEEAEKLKTLIDRAEKNAMDALKEANNLCKGECVIELKEINLD